MQRKRNILIFPGGTEIGLETYKGLKDCKGIKLFSASDNYPNHSAYAFEQNFIIPGIKNRRWLKELNNLIVENDIHYIFPGNDIILDALLDKREQLKAKLIASPKETCQLLRSKLKTYKKFSSLLPTPKIYSRPTEIDKYPVFVKPDDGYGAQGALKVENKKILLELLSNNPKLIISEYLSGKEYTVDCFTERRKGLLFCSGRDRQRIRMGTSMRSTIVSPALNKKFKAIAQVINNNLELHGTWYFQLKEDQLGTLKLLEISPRIAGTMALHRSIGINFPLLSIYDEEGVNIEILINKYKKTEIDRCLLNRYHSASTLSYRNVYVDLDDTIIVHKRINLDMITFLYQCLNKGCKIILISKSLTDIDKALKASRIKELFDEIIWLKEHDSKVKYIKSKDAIFIDDSFSQRKEVSEKLGIPTFDPSMIESLIDSRI